MNVDLKIGKKRELLILVLALNVFAVVSLGTTYAAENDKVENPKILVHNGAGAYAASTDIDSFTGNATNWGYTIVDVKSVNSSVLKDIDILILNQNDLINKSEIDPIVDWWEKGHSKTVWIAGDSDYNGYFDYYTLNNLTIALGGNIILQDDALQDDENNDASAYRVLSNITNPDYSEIVSGITQVITHSPCPVAPYDGTYNGLETTNPTWDDLPNTDWILNTSKAGRCLDQDNDLKDSPTAIWEGYPILEPDSIGSWTTLAVQWNMGSENKSKLIVCGEPIFSDYKLQFGSVSEYGNATTNDKLVKNLLAWGTPEAAPAASPGFETITLLGAMTVLSAIVIIRRRR